MITLFIIIMVIVFIVLHDNENKRENIAQDKAKAERATIASLPDIHYEAKEMSKFEKAMNLNPADKDLLQSFTYHKIGQTITLKMKNGDTITGEISRLEVWFEKWAKENHIVTVSNGKNKIKFYSMAYIFTDQQWEVILHMLSLAGKAHNIIAIEPESKMEKNLSRANTILKIVKHLS